MESTSQRLAQLEGDIEREAQEAEADRLYQLAIQEGLFGKEDTESYSDVYNYIVQGIEPADEGLLKKLQDIQQRDKAGEWVKEHQLGFDIEKAEQNTN